MKEQLPSKQQAPEQPKKQGLVIPVELAQALVNYLGRQPHNDVAGFIQALATSPVVNITEGQAPTPA